MPNRSLSNPLSWMLLAAAISIAVSRALDAFPTSAPVIDPGVKRHPRIVSLVAGVTDTLTALGASDDIVNASSRATSASDAAAQNGKVRLYANERSGMTNAEGILSLDPDFVFAARELIPCLEGRGLNVVMVPQDTFRDMRSFVREVGRDIGNEQGAIDLLDHMDAKIAEIRVKVAGLARPRVYYEDGQPGRTRGPGTAVHEMIELAGGENIYRDPSVPRPTISIETIVAADPEVIVVPSNVTPASVAARQGWSHLSAVRNGRIFSIGEGDRSVSLYSPKCADCCERTFLRWFHPELFDGGKGR